MPDIHENEKCFFRVKIYAQTTPYRPLDEINFVKIFSLWWKNWTLLCKMVQKDVFGLIFYWEENSQFPQKWFWLPQKN